MRLLKVLTYFSKKEAPPMFKQIIPAKKEKQTISFKQIKKMFTEVHQDEAIKSNILENYSPHQIYKQIDTKFEHFFEKRPYTTHSFNFLLTVLTSQNKEDEFYAALTEMDNMNIAYDRLTYVTLIRGMGRFKDVRSAEKFYEKAKLAFGDSIYYCNALIDVYSKNYVPQQGEKMFNDMIQNGLEPDVQVYTSLINGFYRTRQFDKCWEYFNKVRVGDSSNSPDEVLVGLMIEVCAATNDAEKAIWLYTGMDSMEFKETTLVCNAYIKALGSRPDYSQRAVEHFQMMRIKNIPIDSDTVVHTLKACAGCGDVKTAFEVVSLQKQNGIPNSKYIFTQMIRVYVGASNIKNIDVEVREKYIADAWVILNQAITEKKVDAFTLNAMCELMVVNEHLADLEGLVLPLYDQLKINKDAYTYQHIINILNSEKRIVDVFRLFDEQCSKFTPTFQSICFYLESAMLAADEDKVIQSLEWFNKIGRMPKYKYLSMLGNLKNLPVRIHAILDEYPRKFGIVGNKQYKSTQTQK